MRMTIDEHIGGIEDLESAIKIWMPDPEKTQINQSLHVAIETMRKYQKIERIIKGDWEKGYQHSETINRIKDVVEGVMKNGSN